MANTAGLRGFVVWFDDASARRFRPGVESKVAAARGAVAGPGFGAYVRARSAVPGHRCAPHEGRPLVRDDAIVVFWGWIANRAEIADRIGRPELRCATEEALLLAAYGRWGRRFPEMVEGEFSLALFDRWDGSVLAARDALGLKKSFALRTGRRTWVSSHLELLFAFLGRTAELDREQIGRAIHHGGFPGDPSLTLYRGVSQLPPGHLTFYPSCGAQRTVRYWRPQARAEKVRDEAAAAQRFAAVLRRNVEAALPAYGPVLVELVDSLDASSVVAFAASVLSAHGRLDRLTTISTIDPEHDPDASAAEFAVWAEEGLAHATFELDSESRLEDLVGRATPEALGLQTLRAGDRQRLHALGAHVCLTGEGVGKVLGRTGSPRFVADLFWGRDWRSWWRAIAAFSAGQRYGVLELLRLSLRRSFTRVHSVPPWLTAPETIGDDSAAEPVFDLPARQSLLDGLGRVAANVHDEPWGPIEHRHPLLGRSLVEHVLHLPWDRLIQPGRTQVIQRRAVSEILPSRLRDRTGSAERPPGLARRLGSLTRREPRLRGRWLGDLGVVDPGRFVAALDRVAHGSVGAHHQAVVTAAAFELWLEANQGEMVIDAAALEPLARWAVRASDGNWMPVGSGVERRVCQAMEETLDAQMGSV